jgi:penicillin-binding protein 1B
MYRDVRDFAMPEGVQSVLIDPESLELATASCPTTREEVYVAGSAPTQFCELHGGHGLISSTGSWLSRVFGGGQPEQPKTGPDGQPLPTEKDAQAGPDTQGKTNTATETEEKKKNPLQKIFGIFGGKKKDSDKAKPKPEKGDSP